MTETRNGRLTSTTGKDRQHLRIVSNSVGRLPTIPDYKSMRVIPWSDIWTSLSLAKCRGNDPMIHSFYNILFRDAVFDDRGAWSLNIPRAK